MELIPDFQPLHNGDSPVGPSGSYYMGGANKGQGLDAEQSNQLNQMINENKPKVEEDNMDRDVEIFAWFLDEEFVEVEELPIRQTAGGQNARVNGGWTGAHA
ncbi:hypothetical protein FB451DRAFT_1170124 [Mycena latifolia]|nr:hypothetical protein FB451DRAFT_1170124 [Mycena latifolia]